MIKNLRLLMAIFSLMSLLLVMAWMFSGPSSSEPLPEGTQLLQAISFLLFLAHAVVSGYIATKLLLHGNDNEVVTNYLSLTLYVLMYLLLIPAFNFDISQLIIWDLLPLFYGPVCALFEMLIRPQTVEEK